MNVPVAMSMATVFAGTLLSSVPIHGAALLVFPDMQVRRSSRVQVVKTGQSG